MKTELLRVPRPPWPCSLATRVTHDRHGRGTRKPAVILFIALLCLLPIVSFAQNPSSSASTPSGSHLAVYLLTMGPGDQIFERFGHNAIVIADRTTGESLAYNYGIFAFDDGFIFRFLKGRMMYWMDAGDGDEMIQAYAADDRSIWIQELNLTSAQKLKLADHLAWNVRDQNKYYLYNYYNNNCSTKVRDAIDLAVGGAIAEQLKGKPTGRSYRWHTRRIVASSPAIYTALSFVLGPSVDREISQWEESFLPEELMAYLRSVTILDDAGNREPIVASERKLRTSTRFANRPAPPRGWIVGYALAGALIALVFVILARKSQRPWARRSLLAIAIIWPFFVGGAGAFLTWGFTTEHWSVYWNENWLQFNPVALALALLLPLAIRGSAWARKHAFAVAAIVFAGALIGFVAQAAPSLNQHNGEMIALMLPAHAGLAWAAWLISRTPSPAPASATSNKRNGPATAVGPIRKHVS